MSDKFFLKKNCNCDEKRSLNEFKLFRTRNLSYQNIRYSPKIDDHSVFVINCIAV